MVPELVIEDENDGRVYEWELVMLVSGEPRLKLEGNGVLVLLPSG